MKKVYFATDHAGFELKEHLKGFVEQLGYDVDDSGAFGLDTDDDYPDFVAPAIEKMLADDGSCAIILGGSGSGEAILANKFPGARAIVFYGDDVEIAYAGRHHNNANVLSVGARFTTLETAKEAVQAFLETEFAGEERHVRRIKKIQGYEK
ncbi:MAG: RpiB/LacA/LacB family sugar-phosphate isomerase [Candidatus Nomurabacteria bacterium]|nr:RpiB/LacA/LacB family sugar-phosphate isomerase [Candidatus Nomurabacteria bacterium]